MSIPATPDKDNRPQPPQLHSTTLTNLEPHEELFAPVGRCASTLRDITLCYQTFGKPSDPCVLLIQGIGVSLLGYAPSFITHLVAAGYYVIRFDNRDTGRSTNFNDLGSPALVRFALPEWMSLGERVPYRLEDMAADCVGLLDALKVQRAHIFGASMGGMIAQLIAVHYPARVLSLGILFSHMGGADAVEPSYLSYARFLVPPRSGSDADRAEHQVWMLRFLSQGHHRNLNDPHEAQAMKEDIMGGFTRDGDQSSKGVLRHIAAVMRGGSRRAALEALNRDPTRPPIPTLVMHGACDPLVPVKNGYRLAQTIDEAKLVIFPQLGHDFPPELYREWADEMVLNFRKGDRIRGTTAPNSS